jgi:hypothetical protein
VEVIIFNSNKFQMFERESNKEKNLEMLKKQAAVKRNE